MAMKRKNLPEVVPELFEHEQFGQFRYIKRGEEILFVGVDVCNVLGYTNSRKALKDHVPDKFKRGERVVTPYGVQNMTLISEPGLYRLIMRSNLPAAEKFMDWVCEEVLPSIRKYGYYSVAAEKKLVVYSGKPAPELLGEKLTYDEFFDAIDKLLISRVEIRQLSN